MSRIADDFDAIRSKMKQSPGRPQTTEAAPESTIDGLIRSIHAIDPGHNPVYIDPGSGKLMPLTPSSPGSGLGSSSGSPASSPAPAALSRSQMLAMKLDEAAHAVMCFTWTHTLEGGVFWSTVHHALKRMAGEARAGKVP